MALIEASYFSPALQKHVQLKALVPNSGHGPFPVCYLLHGLSDDHSIWLRNTRLEFYVRDLPLIVVMPDGFQGFYTDNEEGHAYGKYMIEDVLGFAERVLPVKRERSARCIGGLSMGGYGSLRLALENPGMFVSANSHSGAVGIDIGKIDRDPLVFQRIFGKNPKDTKHDVSALARKVVREGHPRPKLRLDCGLQDFLLERNRKFHNELTALGYTHEYAEYPGMHNWDYWDEHIVEALEFHCRALGLAMPPTLSSRLLVRAAELVKEQPGCRGAPLPRTAFRPAPARHRRSSFHGCG
jgi:S-formylglutathione hydrolase FrmB